MTLIEIMVAIAVIAFIVIGGLYLFNIIKERQKIHNSVNDLGAIVTVINDIYAYADNYEDLSVESLINSGGIPKHLIIAGNTQHFKGAWGNIDLSVDTEEHHYTITFNNVTDKVCLLFSGKVRNVYRYIFTPQTTDIDKKRRRNPYCTRFTTKVFFRYYYPPIEKETTLSPDGSPTDGS